MAVEQFNSLGGFSVGIPPISIVDSNGNIVTNINNLSGNVSANKIYANSFYYANGEPFVGSSGNGTTGGPNGSIQFNNLGNFGGSSNLTFNETTNTLTVKNISILEKTILGNISDFVLHGGNTGQVLSTDGNGNLSWITPSGGTGNGSPGGISGQLQFNNNGAFAGTNGITFDDNTNILSINEVNITDLNAINIDANTISVNNSITTSNITVNNTLRVNSTLRITGNINTSGSPNIYLGPIGNIKITGGTNGQVLTTDGDGNLSWQTGSGSGDGNPGGANTQIQFNNNGVFAGDPKFTYNQISESVNIGGKLVANSTQIGSGAYKFCTSEVYFASTIGTAPTVLYSIPVDQISGVEFHIIGTDSTASARQSSKISTICYGGNIQFNEYAGLQINGGVGNFEVDYNAGNVVIPPSLQLKVTPNRPNNTQYKVLITVYA